MTNGRGMKMDFKKTVNRAKKQKGFTLVEIAIVLVIIGLLLGGVLKGQEMINSAKIKSDTDALQALQASTYAYRDRMGIYPGSERSADPTVSADDGLLIIADASNDAADGGKAGDGVAAFFAELNDQGFLKDTAPVPSLDDTGYFYAFHGSVAGDAPGDTPMTVEPNKNYVCIVLNVENGLDVATGMDVKLGDGVADEGIVRVDADTTVDAGGGVACLEI